jgi:hypothetical protein
MSRKIRLDFNSNSRSVGIPENYTIDIDPTTRIRGFQVKRVEVPNTVYQANTGNNVLVLSADATQYVAVPIGIYTATRLCSTLRSALITYGMSSSITVSYSTTTYKFTITSPTPFSIYPNSIQAYALTNGVNYGSIGSLMGFTSNQINVTSATSDLAAYGDSSIILSYDANIVFTYSGTDYTVILPAAMYTIYSIAAKIAALMNARIARVDSSIVFNVVLNSVTFIYTFTANVPFILKYDYTSRALLGMVYQGNLSSTAVGATYTVTPPSASANTSPIFKVYDLGISYQAILNANSLANARFNIALLPGTYYPEELERVGPIYFNTAMATYLSAPYSAYSFAYNRHRLTFTLTNSTTPFIEYVKSLSEEPPVDPDGSSLPPFVYVSEPGFLPATVNALGFINDQSSNRDAPPYSVEGIPVAQPRRNIFIKSRALCANLITKPLANGTETDIIYKIQINTDFGNTLTQVNHDEEDFYMYDTNVTLSTLDFRIEDDYNESIALNGKNWSISIVLLLQ